ncbi:MAG: hypothetical protein ABIR58_04865 [Gemmatimonadaceae bacterium]
MRHCRTTLGLVAGVLLVAGCGEANLFNASLPTARDSYTIFALTGSPVAYPSGINTFIRQAVRVDGNANFDVAFDIDAAGDAIVYPARLIVSSLSGNRPVGLQKVAGTFESVLSAPRGKYVDSLAVAAKAGAVIVIEAARNGSGDVCQFSISPFIYTKLLIESIVPATRTIIVQSVLNPNCGSRSFEPGIPAN